MTFHLVNSGEFCIFATDMTIIAIGLLIPLLGTVFGSAFVFLMKDEMSDRVQKTLLGFASGVMVAASVWSLLIPAMEMEESKGAWSVLPAAVGFLFGMGFLLVLDEPDSPPAHRYRYTRGSPFPVVTYSDACPCRYHP